MSPDDQQTASEGRRVHPLFESRMSRLKQLRTALGVGPTLLDDDTLLAIRDGIKRVERGTR